MMHKSIENYLFVQLVFDECILCAHPSTLYWDLTDTEILSQLCQISFLKLLLQEHCIIVINQNIREKMLYQQMNVFLVFPCSSFRKYTAVFQ